MNSENLTNQTFDEIAIGATAELSRSLTRTGVEALAMMSGQIDPCMLEGERTGDAIADDRANAAGAEALVAAVLGSKLPGPGMRIVDQNLHFDGTVRIGDTLTARIKAREKRPATREIVFDCRCVNQDDVTLVSGSVTVVAPTDRVRFTDVAPPELALRRGDEFHKLLGACKHLPPIRCGIVHPCDRGSLVAALEASQRGLLDPVLIGPLARIQAVAVAEHIDLGDLPIVDVPHSHAAAARAVEMARAGQFDALMKGSIHTGELLGEIVSSKSGMRTARRISHVYVIDVPSHPRILLVSDAAVNICPTLEDKIDIVQNAIDLAHVIGIAEPKVAILSAIETVNPKIRSTVEAAALCKMAERGQISGGIVDGPLAFDNAISLEAARKKKITSPVAGRADILITPDLEAGNMLVKQLVFMAGADGAGIVMGARVPIVLTSRADSVRTRLASIAVANLVANARRTKTP
jgi:phosphotransacetylase/acyl dehydratase